MFFVVSFAPNIAAHGHWNKATMLGQRLSSEIGASYVIPRPVYGRRICFVLLGGNGRFLVAPLAGLLGMTVSRPVEREIGRAHV